MNTPVGNVTPKLDASPKRRTIEIEFPAEVYPADKQPEVTVSPQPLGSLDISAPDQMDGPTGLAEDVLELETNTVEAKASSTVAVDATAGRSDVAETSTETVVPVPAQSVAPSTAPVEAPPAREATSSIYSLSEDETIKLLMDLASLQEDLERAREQTNSARRHVEIVKEQLSKTMAEKGVIQDQFQQLQDQLQQLMAEFDNYRRRTEREKVEAMERGKQAVLLMTLEVLDNIERALATGRAEGGTLGDFLAGVELIQRQVIDSLSSFGVKPISAVGEIFDPMVHEAIATDETEEYKPNTVLAELKRGYKLGERLLRPAMVRVAIPPSAS
ncbi:MAG: nucleotide exchange factor GrpE [Acidobacteriota bacterium]